jgi:hypothetical protein
MSSQTKHINLDDPFKTANKLNDKPEKNENIINKGVSGILSG